MTTALITGGNRGLGRAVAQVLADRGMTVIIGARNGSEGERAAREIGPAATSVQIDVTDDGSVAAAATWVAEQFGGLDVLINNAGVMPEVGNPTTEVVDRDMFRRTYATNLLGAVGVIEAFLPQLRASARGRIVNVSSRMGSVSDQADPESPYFDSIAPAYQSSKAALNSVTISLAKLLVDTPIKVTSVCPGFVQTDLSPINRQHGPLTPEQAVVVIAQAAQLADDAPSGTFVDSDGTVPW